MFSFWRNIYIICFWYNCAVKLFQIFYKVLWCCAPVGEHAGNMKSKVASLQPFVSIKPGMESGLCISRLPCNCKKWQQVILAGHHKDLLWVSVWGGNVCVGSQKQEWKQMTKNNDSSVGFHGYEQKARVYSAKMPSEVMPWRFPLCACVFTCVLSCSCVCGCRCSSRSPWSLTQACIYQMTLCGNHFLEVKGKCAVKFKLWLVVTISLCEPSSDLENSSQLTKIIRYIWTQRVVNFTMQESHSQFVISSLSWLFVSPNFYFLFTLFHVNFQIIK